MAAGLHLCSAVALAEAVVDHRAAVLGPSGPGFALPAPPAASYLHPGRSAGNVGTGVLVAWVALLPAGLAKAAGGRIGSSLLWARPLATTPFPSSDAGGSASSSEAATLEAGAPSAVAVPISLFALLCDSSPGWPSLESELWSSLPASAASRKNWADASALPASCAAAPAVPGDGTSGALAATGLLVHSSMQLRTSTKLVALPATTHASSWLVVGG
eukprot:CAMPEP_0170638870 /NCGR_PEP_ID=MMETSP0224-20130122/39312_1 /TAXON_ID=285029 /ORGANISM="Togula jolla, Strain CCCM 725" /LENGTH=215 /DNA_ID=CAMNT_0010969119 /DNA_START=788 /DNA_END=1437 /DNA_ORIENTATION=-